MHQPSVGFVQRKIVATSRWLIVNPTDGSFGVVAQQECERIEVKQVSCQDFAIKICEGRHRFSCDKNREQLRILPFDTMSRLIIAQTRARMAALLLVLVLFPIWTSLVVRCYAWLVLLQRRDSGSSPARHGAHRAVHRRRR